MKWRWYRILYWVDSFIPFEVEGGRIVWKYPRIHKWLTYNMPDSW